MKKYTAELEALIQVITEDQEQVLTSKAYKTPIQKAKHIEDLEHVKERLKIIQKDLSLGDYMGRCSCGGA